MSPSAIGIRDWIATWDESPRPFTWTQAADEILASVASYHTKTGIGTGTLSNRGRTAT